MEEFENCPKCKKPQKRKTEKLCDPCNQELIEKKKHIAEKVKKGRAVETCGICRACGSSVSGSETEKKGGAYAHAIIPQSLIKKTDIIILRFLTLVYSAAFEKGLNADTLDIDKQIEGVCKMVEERICLFSPSSRDVLKAFYQDLMRELEGCICKMICPSSSASSSSTSSDFCLPQRFVQLTTVSELVHITEIIGKGSLERFGIGKQCKVCEQLQGDDSVIVRHDKFRIESSHPPTFVGNKCLELIGPGTVRGFVWKWLRTNSTDELCVIDDIFKNLKNPESCATKVLIKLKDVFKCFYSLQMLALADGFSLHEEGLDQMLGEIQPKLPIPVRKKKDSDEQKGKSAENVKPDNDGDGSDNEGLGLFM